MIDKPLPNIELFHVHVPKTAGSSLNWMLKKAFGPAFCSHEIQRIKDDPSVRVAAAHMRYSTAKRVFPNARFVTILREPESRMKSEMRYFFARKGELKYRDLGEKLNQFIDDNGYFLPNEELISSHDFKFRFDNTLVRYLKTTGHTPRVSDTTLLSAVEGLGQFMKVISQDNFEHEASALFDELGCSSIEPDKRNLARTKIPLWETLPSILEPYLAHDRKFFKIAASTETVEA